MHNTYTQNLILIILFFGFPALSGATDCDCVISKVADKIHYSTGCNDKDDICSLTVGEGVGVIDLSAFTDLRDVTVTVLSGAHPEFLVTTLVNVGTDIQLGVLDGLLATDASVRIIENTEVLQVYDSNGDFNLLGGTLLNLGLCLDADLYVTLLGGLITLDLDLNSANVLACTFVAVVGDKNLPVELVDWSAAAVAPAAVDLEWETASERDNAYFRLLHATDGVNYAEIARLTGRGTTDRSSVYRHRHAAPRAGTNYYRLEQVDYDGTVENLGIRQVHLEGHTDEAVVAFPNPVAAGATVRLSGTDIREEGTALLADGTGRTLGHLPVGADGSLQLPADLQPGLYLLRYADAVTRLSVLR